MNKTIADVKKASIAVKLGPVIKWKIAAKINAVKPAILIFHREFSIFSILLILLCDEIVVALKIAVLML
ncbi:hypothetical protein [Planococcus maritimus]|uniref:hypothetical protein n=1 Tax=Planococcus maritimus TaxID=192421 RepID=UPI001428C1D4|nr:hypothetical protein [Planococcus maritimus]